MELKNIDGHFTVDDDASLRERILSDLETILGRLLPLVRGFVEPLAVALVGGFGRGEGGAVARDGVRAPVNDYDFLVVIKPASTMALRRMRREAAGLARDLEGEIGMQVDLDFRTEAGLRAVPNVIAWYEIQRGHKVIWGAEGALAAMPELSAGRIGLWDGGNLLFNRSSGLLFVKKRLLDGGPEEGYERMHSQIQMQKAAQSWGDCVLLMRGCYDSSYRRRIEIARGMDFSEAPGGGRLREKYIEALERKIRPEFAALSRDEYEAMFASTVAMNEEFALWFERARLDGKFADWREYSRPGLLKLDIAPCKSGGLKNVIKNCLAFGLPLGGGEVSRYFHSVVERCVSAMPLLLYGRDGQDIALAAKILRIGDIGSDGGPESASQIIGRYLALWH